MSSYLSDLLHVYQKICVIFHAACLTGTNDISLHQTGKKKENRLKFIIRLTNKQEFYDRSTSQTNTQLLLWTSGTHTTDEQYGAS